MVGNSKKGNALFAVSKGRAFVGFQGATPHGKQQNVIAFCDACHQHTFNIYLRLSKSKSVLMSGPCGGTGLSGKEGLCNHNRRSAEPNPAGFVRHEMKSLPHKRGRNPAAFSRVAGGERQG